MLFAKIYRTASTNPLLPLAGAAVIGILVGDRIYPEISPNLLGAALALSITGFFALGKARRSSFFALALTTLVFAFIHLLRLENGASFPLADALEKYPAIDVVADGIVVDTPRPLSSEGLNRYPLRLLSIDDHRTLRETGHLLSVIHDGPPPEYGDRLRLHGKLRALRRARNPHEFNLSAFRARSGVAGELRVRSSAPVAALEKHRGNPLYRAALRSRDWIRRTITRGLGDSTEASVLAAMVLGERDRTPDAVETNFRHSGALHIFAVSGLHVGIFGGVLWMLLKTLGVPRTRAVLLIIPCLLFYAYLTGLRPSAVRAAVMASIYLMGILMGRPPRLLNSLAAAALLILTFDTQQIFLPGFQLSFAVLAAIALLAPPIRRRLHHRIQPDPFIPSSLVPAATRRAVKAGRSIADLAAVSTAAWIGSAPLGLWHFHLVTPVALVANMFFVPLAFVTLSVATMSLLSAGVGLGALSILLNHLNGITAKLLLLASAGFASLPGSHFYIDPFPSRQSETCRVTVLDTGLGGAAQLISVKRPRTRILVDCGGTGSFFEVVRPFLRGEGGARLDALVLTHGDAQHLGGAAPLMSAHSPATIFQSPLRNRSPYYRDFLAAREALAPSAPPLLDVVAGDLIFEADEGDTSLRVLYPPAKTNQDFAADNQCLVLLLECHGWRVLLLSDSGFVTEKWLLENESQLRCDVMIKGRHRSDFSGLPEFLNATRPGAIVCTNFHFPQEERLEKSWVEDAENRGIQVFDQAATGAVRIDLTAGELRVESFLTDQVFTKRAR